MSPTKINIKAQNEEGEIRRFSTDASFAMLRASLASRFYAEREEGLSVTYKDESDDDVCLSNDEDLQTALQITDAASGAKPLRLKVALRARDVAPTSGLANLHIGDQNATEPPLRKQFKHALRGDPSLLLLMQDDAVDVEEKAKALESHKLDHWFVNNQHAASEVIAKLQMKQGFRQFGAPAFGKGKGGKCGKGKGIGAPGFHGKGKGKGCHEAPYNRMHHKMMRLQEVLAWNPEIRQQLLDNPNSVEPIRNFPRLHQFCLNHPELLQEQLNRLSTQQEHSAHLENAAIAGHAYMQEWTPIRNRVIRYLSNHDGPRQTLSNDSTPESIEAVMANKPGMLRFLLSDPSQLPTLLKEAEMYAAKKAKSSDTEDKKQKKLIEQEEKYNKKMERKHLKVRMKVVKYLTKHQKELVMLKADPSCATASSVFAAKPKLKSYLMENEKMIPHFVQEASILVEDVNTSSSYDETMDDDTVVVVSPTVV